MAPKLWFKHDAHFIESKDFNNVTLSMLVVY
jgi:hypothetical protein